MVPYDEDLNGIEMLNSLCVNALDEEADKETFRGGDLMIGLSGIVKNSSTSEYLCLSPS